MLLNPSHACFALCDYVHARHTHTRQRWWPDGARPFVESDRFRRCCPQLQVAATPEVGHYQPLLAPQAVSERITEFLAGLGD